jgi:hypothetical protein
LVYCKNPHIINSEIWGNVLVYTLYLQRNSYLISRLITSLHFRCRRQNSIHQPWCVIRNNISEIILLKFENMIQNLIIGPLLFSVVYSEPLRSLRTYPLTLMYTGEKRNEENLINATGYSLHSLIRLVKNLVKIVLHSDRKITKIHTNKGDNTDSAYSMFRLAFNSIWKCLL